MATIEEPPARYQLLNEQNVKQIAIVVEIPGIDLLSSRPIYTRIRYGDPDIFYGDPGLVYGGLRRLDGVRDILSFDGSSLTIQQIIEPEQGRASVTTMTMAFVDKDEYMSQVISPGVLIDEILGKPVKIWLGFEEISYPQDYQVIFRGIVTSTDSQSGRVTIQFSDPNVVRRQNIFYSASTRLTAPITDIATNIPVVTTGDFHKQILGPDGFFDTTVETWILVGDEYMEYGPVGYTSNTFTVTRSAIGPLGESQTPIAHDADTDVRAVLVLHENPITMALKIMLSAWNGYFQTGVGVDAFVVSSDPVIGNDVNGILLDAGKSATRDYGLSVGDYITTTGATVPGNNTTCTITGFAEAQGDSNRFIFTSATFTPEITSPAVMALRSQYDVYPITAGLKVIPSEVDVNQHEYIRNTFLGSEVLKFQLTAPETGKSFIESELFLPMACYSVTKQGKLSVGLTTPPIAGERLQVLTAASVLDPKNIRPNRGLNNRKFFNQIDWEYDVSQAGAFQQVSRFFDSESLSIIGITSVLPIKSRGGRADLGFTANVERRSTFLLDRYKRGAIQITIKVTYEMANIIEAGDVIILQDDGTLKITNFTDGSRNLGSQLYEVINRTLDIKGGFGNLTLITAVGINLQDKFATFSPSSVVGVGSTNVDIYIVDSYGSFYPFNESKKYADYVGLPIRVHTYDYSFDEEVTLVSIDPGNPYKLTVSPPLSLAPTAGYIVDICQYSTSTDPNVNANYKLVHVHWTPSVDITLSISDTQFEVAPGDIGKFQIGQPIYTHNAAYTVLFASEAISDEARVTDITGVTVTVDTSLGYTPIAGDIVELIGFPDGGPPYRWV